MLPLVLLPQQAAPADRWLSTAAAFHRAQNAGSARIQLVTVDQGIRRQRTLSVDWKRPGTVRLLLNSGLGTQTYWLDGGTVTGWDQDPNERLRKSVNPNLGIANRLASSIGSFGRAVDTLLDAQVAERFFAEARTGGNWKVEQRAGTVRLVRSSRQENRDVRVELRLSARDGRLLAVRNADGPRVSEWVIEYGSTALVARKAPPASAKTVVAFVQPPEAIYASPAARVTARNMMLSLASFQGSIRRTGEDGTRTLRVGDGQYGEDAANLRWAWDGKTASVLRSRPLTYHRGPSRSARPILTTVAALGGRVDPMMARWLGGIHPYLPYFGPEIRVSQKGTVVLGGAACSILEISKPGSLRTTAFVRQKDGLVASLGTETLDRSGAAISTTRLEFAYRPGNPGSFRIPAPRGVPVRKMLLPPKTPAPSS